MAGSFVFNGDLSSLIARHISGSQKNIQETWPLVTSYKLFHNTNHQLYLKHAVA